MTEKKYESKILDNSIAYFKFSEFSGQDSFQLGLNEFMEFVKKPEVKYLLVHVSDMTNAWSSEGQHVWINTGVFAQDNGILKWGVVCPDDKKKLTIRHLIKGAGSPRSYDTLVTDTEEECISWLKS